MGVIISKGNKGNHPIKFKEHFKRELRQWEDIDRRFSQNFQTIEASTSETAGDTEAPSFETTCDHQSPNIEYSTSGAYGIPMVEETNIQLEQNEVELNDNVEIVNDIGDENAGRDGFRRVRRRGRDIATPPAPLTSDRRERKKPDKFTHSTDHVKAIRAKTKRKSMIQILFSIRKKCGILFRKSNTVLGPGLHRMHI
ncbi:unnamed protein product [Lathyrus sativus]|nr:unnamed protein product [Lathyrus sativus]